LFTDGVRMHHELAGQYALHSAPEREFGIHYAVCRNANPDFDDFLEYGSDLEGLHYCFWVCQSHARIGGVILRPNHIEGLVLRPPHAQSYEVLQAVLPLLVSWSDRTKPVEAADVAPDGTPREDGRRLLQANHR
jgi:hypothetical protein